MPRSKSELKDRKAKRFHSLIHLYYSEALPAQSRPKKKDLGRCKIWKGRSSARNAAQQGFFFPFLDRFPSLNSYSLPFNLRHSCSLVFSLDVAFPSTSVAEFAASSYLSQCDLLKTNRCSDQKINGRCTLLIHSAIKRLQAAQKPREYAWKH